MVMEEVQKEEDNVLTALFTACLVLLMVCLKRALLLFLVEQWRAWIFLVLNILLLAIFFTSTKSSTRITTRRNEPAEKLQQGAKIEKRKEIDQCGGEYEDDASNCKQSKAEEVENVEAEGEQCKLSKEELNERVEAFIAMFRQHLASDARKSRKFQRASCGVRRLPLLDLSVPC